MVRKTLALALMLTVAVASPALAQDPDPYTEEDAIVLSDSTVAPGGDFVATVGVCEPATEGTFDIDGEAAGSGIADEDGQASDTLTAPSENGTHTVTGRCTGPD